MSGRAILSSGHVGTGPGRMAETLRLRLSSLDTDQSDAAAPGGISSSLPAQRRGRMLWTPSDTLGHGRGAGAPWEGVPPFPSLYLREQGLWTWENLMFEGCHHGPENNGERLEGAAQRRTQSQQTVQEAAWAGLGAG